ncbi:MAG: L,D-transpeptidase, partial [Peptostreptococcaceae bacterium]
MYKKTKKVICMLLTLVILFSSSSIYSYAASAPSHCIIVNTQTNKLGYYKNGKLVKQFKVATGKSSTQTPTGKSKIVNKIKNRPYYSGGIPGGDPRNPLGDRWLGLQLRGTYGTTYGIH